MIARMIPGALLAFIACAGSDLWAQDPPDVTPGYATEGRPGFVYIGSTESVVWQRFNVPGIPGGMMAKYLSRDEKRGGLTLLSYLPIRWQHDERGYHNSDEEIFLLEGDLTIGDQQLSKYSYTFIPAGVAHGPVSTRQGAVFIRWFNKTPDFNVSRNDKSGARAYASVRDWNHYQVPWDSVNFPVYRKGPPVAGVRLKLLRNDPDTGEMTWIFFGLAGRRGGSLWEVHPTFEEYFILELSDERVVGECLPEGPTGLRYKERGYWWRPAGIGHLGPITVSSGYSMSIIRTGAALWADYFTDCSYKQQVDLSETSNEAR